MTDKNSPFYSYDPSSVGRLHRRKRDGLEILNDDLVRILEADAELVPDPLLRDLLVEGLKGCLRARRGRKKTPSGKLRELDIVVLYDLLLPRLQARHDRNKQRGIRAARGDYAPAELACKLIGNRMNMEWESVRNLISLQKNR
jgi:hypothetical protein